MHRAHLLLLAVAAMAAAAVWLWQSGEEVVLPAAEVEAETGDPAAAETAATAERAAAPLAGRGQESDPPATAPGDDAAATTDDAGADDAKANVIVAVRSAATREPIDAFRVTFRLGIPTVPGTTVRADGTNGVASLTLAPRARGQLLVEADRHLPASQPLLAPGADELPLRLELFLDASAAMAGITLVVRDPEQRPVGHVRVEAQQLTAEVEDADWATGHSLWARRTSNEDGRYTLPELAPGRYGIRLAATEPDGALRPLQPFRRVFALTGTNGYLEDVVLEPGTLLTLDLQAQGGAGLDPDEVAIHIDLRQPGGPAISRRWHQQGERGLIATIDGPPGPGPCWLDAAVAPGNYWLSIGIDGQTRVRQQLMMLRSGERQAEVVVVR
ncbi:MAG: carboxypeptidase regulatory-like domain-containing protein [Planctomycetes bacterium]|nr:carboxypeptidase regulatory-like domain-containing protein [Planctomycetota bacterium]